MNENYIACADELPPEGQVVMTKIDDEKGVRNEQPLYRQGRLWFFASGSMYVYYKPTHWHAMPSAERAHVDSDGHSTSITAPAR